MDVTTLLRTAIQAVDDAEVPSDLRSVALAKALDFLAGEASRSPEARQSAGRTVDVGGRNELERIASRLGLPLEAAEQAFVIEGDKLELVIPASRIDPAKSRGTEQIATLVAAGRQASGLDEDGWTSVDHIREVCENYKRYDSSNFATTIRDMDDVFTVRGTGRDRKVRMTAPAWQRAKDLLSSLVGVG